MANYANQKTVHVDKKGIEQLRHKEHTNESFLMPIDWKNIRQIKSDLNDCGFTVWLYLMEFSGVENGIFFSPAKIRDDFNISTKSAQRGFQELESKGYIKEIKPNVYQFTPVLY